MYNRKNHVELSGYVTEGGFGYAFHKDGEEYDACHMEVARLSGTKDRIKVVAPRRLLCGLSGYGGTYIRVSGSFCSYRHPERTPQIDMYVLADWISGEEPEPEDRNEVVMEGMICRPPHYKETYHGRKVTNLILIVPKPKHGTDYISVLCWGGNAVKVSSFKEKDVIRLRGRIQSREYSKVLGDGVRKITVHEISANLICAVSEHAAGDPGKTALREKAS